MKYYVYWISPRRIANEGDYVYGSEYWMDQELGMQGAKESFVSEHRTERAAIEYLSGKLGSLCDTLPDEENGEDTDDALARCRHIIDDMQAKLEEHQPANTN